MSKCVFVYKNENPMSNEHRKEEQPEEGAGKIMYPLELQMLVFDYIAWMESMIVNVKKSLRPQITDKIKKLSEYRFALPSKSEPAGEKMQEELWCGVIVTVEMGSKFSEVVKELKSKYIIQKR